VNLFADGIAIAKLLFVPIVQEAGCGKTMFILMEFGEWHMRDDYR
jgi:hypothetical protein